VASDKYKHFVGALTRQLVYVDMNLFAPCFMWLTPAMTRKLYFSMQGIETGTYPLPPLLWILKGTNLTLYAYKEWLGDKTELFAAPYPNTNNSVCLGYKGSQFIRMAAESTINPQDLIDAAEHAFFETAFSHGGEGNAKSPMEKLYAACLGRSTFPMEELVPRIKEFKTLLQSAKQSSRDRDFIEE
jgi:hypothetical protein